MNIPEDTIAAVATPYGDGGIGILRISGPEALGTLKRLFQFGKPPSSIEPNRLYYGHARLERGGVLEEAMAVYLKAPRSFTREDTVEISTHGSRLVLEKLLSEAILEGARLAEPGEFTRRAFVNGRIDLAQAEAVIDVIRARSEGALRIAENQLRGGLSRRIVELRRALIGVLASVEASIDFAEEDLEPMEAGRMSERLCRISSGMDSLVTTFDEGRLYREGVSIAIVGRPNAGKSSLLNALVSQRKAIVSRLPGTTRDAIEGLVSIRGVPLRLIDTAGYRESGDEIEAMGVRVAEEKMREADRVLSVLDSSERLQEIDHLVLEATKGRDRIIVLNKSDLPGVLAPGDLPAAGRGTPVLSVSALRGDGIEKLKDEIIGGIGKGTVDAGSAAVVSNVRHRNLLLKAREGLDKGRSSLAEGFSMEFVAADLRTAADALGEITGETTTEDVLEKIFSDFCVGK